MIKPLKYYKSSPNSSMNDTAAQLASQIATIKKAFSSGQRDLAISECQHLLQTHPNHIALHKLLANLLALTGQSNLAAKQLKIAFDLEPNDEEVLFNLGICYRQMLSYQEAIEYFSLYTKKYPTKAEGWGSLAECQFQLGNYDDALINSHQAIKISPRDGRLLSNRSKLYRSLKNYELALKDAQDAITIDPSSLSFAIEYAELIQLAHRKSNAIPFFEKVTQLKPKSYIELLFLGKAFYELGNHDQAITIYKQLIVSNQLLELTYLNLGSAYFVLRNHAAAMNAFMHVLRLNPNSLEANLNLANCFLLLYRNAEALPYVQKALEINPSSSQAYKLRAEAISGTQNEDKVLHDYLHAESLEPNLEGLEPLILYQKLVLCDWGYVHTRKSKLIEHIQSNQVEVLPFQSTLFFDEPSIHQLCAQRFIQHVFPKSRYPKVKFPKSEKQRLKVAYVSPDFGNHPVSFLSAELFELHDRTKFEVYAVALTKRDGDSYQDRIKSSVDVWLDISQMSDEQALNLLRSHSIDIAIDLCGHTRHNRMALFANRMAPLQISYLGYLGTSGGSYFMDYLIADKTIIPPEYRSFYDEKIIYLPSYQINDSKRPRPLEDVQKSSLGIPENHFVFACLNNSFKYNPEIFDSWMRILSATPQSSLLLFGKNPTVTKNLRNFASNLQVDPNRLIFLENVPYEEYLKRLKVINLFLDTTIYNAGTTASDALWMGVPVLTCIGKSFCARIAASVLAACDMSNLITNTLSDYESLAIELASNTKKYQAIKQQLIENTQDCKLFNSRESAKAIEKAYQSIWNVYLSDGIAQDEFIDHDINTFEK